MTDILDLPVELDFSEDFSEFVQKGSYVGEVKKAEVKSRFKDYNGDAATPPMALQLVVELQDVPEFGTFTKTAWLSIPHADDSEKAQKFYRKQLVTTLKALGAGSPGLSWQEVIDIINGVSCTWMAKEPQPIKRRIDGELVSTDERRQDIMAIG